MKLAFDEEVEMRGLINPLENGLNWIRGMDVEPKLVKDSEIEEVLKRYNEYKKNL